MSIGSLGIIGGLASSPVAQKAADADKVGQGAADQARQSAASDRAEAAAGIGQMEEESGPGDRDADGRRLWERPPRPQPPAANPEPSPTIPLAKDPRGQSGGLVDLCG